MKKTSEADQALLDLCFLVVDFIIQRGTNEKFHKFTYLSSNNQFRFPGLRKE